MDPVEQWAIAAAIEYTTANGFDPTDTSAVGLVLAGMAIASSASVAAQRQIIFGYLDQFPDAGPSIHAWAQRLTTAARHG